MVKIDKGKRLTTHSIHTLEGDSVIGGREEAIDKKIMWDVHKYVWFQIRGALSGFYK